MNTAAMSPEPTSATAPDERPVTARLWRAGRTGWALLGLAGALALGGYVAGRLSLLVVPVVLALFPATLLVPVADWLCRHKVPGALAALLALVGGILLIVGVIGAMVSLVVAGLPGLAESTSAGLAELEGLLQSAPFGFEIGGFSDLLAMAREQVGQAGDVTATATQAAVTAVETVTRLVLMLVILFFYLKDGRRLADGLVATAPAPARGAVGEIARRSWATLRAYFRGQLLVALIDAVFIGIGLVLLGVPLAGPLAVLIFFGGLFPIVGAVTTGALAVLVALADGGLTAGLLVLALVLAVQQLEGNVFQPMILSRAIDLHPLVVLLSIATGAVVAGILGAFLAVPAAAIIARAVHYLRYERPAVAAAHGGRVLPRTAAYDPSERP